MKVTMTRPQTAFELSRYHPDVRRVRDKDEQGDRRRRGYDCMHSSNKSITLQAAVDPRICPLFERVNKDMLAEIERFVRAKIGDKNTSKATGNCLAAVFIHDLTRLSVPPYNLVPHLHAHNLIINFTHDKDTNTNYYIDPIPLYNAQVWATQYSNVEMTKGLRELGYEVETTRSGPEIKGYTSEAIDAFSEHS